MLSSNTGLYEAKKVLNKCIDTHVELDQQFFKDNYGNLRYRRFQPILNIKNYDLSLDNSDSNLLEIYCQAAEQTSLEFLDEDYGPFKDHSLIDWICENTMRKKEIF